MPIQARSTGSEPERTLATWLRVSRQLSGSLPLRAPAWTWTSCGSFCLSLAGPCRPPTRCSQAHGDQPAHRARWQAGQSLRRHGSWRQLISTTGGQRVVMPRSQLVTIVRAPVSRRCKLRALVGCKSPQSILSRSCVAALVIVACVGLLEGPGLGVARGASTLRILVMGDSYSAGNGAGHYAGPRGCWRSRDNYAGDFSRLVSKARSTSPRV